MQLEPSYICLFVADLEESVVFYRDVLGLAPIPELSTQSFQAFRYSSLVLGLEPRGSGASGEKDKSQNPIILQFRAQSVEDMDTIIDQLKAAGVRILDEKLALSFGTITSFLDLEGNRLEVLYQK